MTTQNALAPSPQEITSSPRFLSTLNVSPEVARLIEVRGIPELPLRALLSYGLDEQELREVLVEFSNEDLLNSHLLRSPQELAKQYSVVEHAGEWHVTDGLGQIRASLDSEQLAYAVCGMYENPCSAITDFPMHPDFVPQQQ